MGFDGIYKKQDDGIPYRELDPNLAKKILENKSKGWVSPYAFKDEGILRREKKGHDEATVIRPAFDRDIEKIMYVPAYNRYNDKTQVFSFMHNDDISRRGLHVQYVSKIARNIGGLLGLNTSLIEAMALGHDIGHTPFGHVGEDDLNNVYNKHTGRFFNHNVHSVRVLDKLYRRNLSLQTLDGILCHNGEIAKQVLEVEPLDSFDAFDKKVENCYVEKTAVAKLVPGTLEACVVRISDIIAYLGKDRIDALQIGAIDDESCFDSSCLGRTNTKIINNMIVDIVENSYGQDHIKMSKEIFDDLCVAKKQNAELIYIKEGMSEDANMNLDAMTTRLYEKFLDDLKAEDKTSPIYTHHIASLMRNSNNISEEDYLREDANDIVVDYLASMTDTYFMAVYDHTFPEDDLTIYFRGYFK